MIINIHIITGSNCENPSFKAAHKEIGISKRLKIYKTNTSLIEKGIKKMLCLRWGKGAIINQLKNIQYNKSL